MAAYLCKAAAKTEGSGMALNVEHVPTNCTTSWSKKLTGMVPVI